MAPGTYTTELMGSISTCFAGVLNAQMPDHVGGFPVDFLKQVVSSYVCMPLETRIQIRNKTEREEPGTVRFMCAPV